MPTGLSQLDNEIHSHEYCGDDSLKKVRKRVGICQEDGESLKVDYEPRGILIPFYNEVSGVALGGETKINEITIPLGKVYDSCNILCSGSNISRFIIKKDGATLFSKRSYWSDFNVEFNLKDLKFNAGEKVQVFVVNNGIDLAEYESTILGNEYDAS